MERPKRPTYPKCYPSCQHFLPSMKKTCQMVYVTNLSGKYKKTSTSGVWQPMKSIRFFSSEPRCQHRHHDFGILLCCVCNNHRESLSANRATTPCQKRWCVGPVRGTTRGVLTTKTNDVCDTWTRCYCPSNQCVGP